MIATNVTASWPLVVVEALQQHQEELLSWARQEIQFDDSDPDSMESILRSNPWHDCKQDLVENGLPKLIKDYGFRLLHYSRLLPEEISDILENGMQPTSTAFLSRRLTQAHTERYLSREEVALLMASTPLNDASQRARHGEVCFISTPTRHSDGGVHPLLNYWGGEMTHFWLQNEDLKHKLGEIGQPTVVECHIRFDHKMDRIRAATAMLNHFIGTKMEWLEPSKCEFHIRRPIFAGEVHCCHTPNSQAFGNLERGDWP